MVFYFCLQLTYSMSNVIIKFLQNFKDSTDEQILEDGGHFELSPMYHNLMFYHFRLQT